MTLLVGVKMDIRWIIETSIGYHHGDIDVVVKDYLDFTVKSETCVNIFSIIFQNVPNSQKAL